jgi:hypothetical protein
VKNYLAFFFPPQLQEFQEIFINTAKLRKIYTYIYQEDAIMMKVLHYHDMQNIISHQVGLLHIVCTAKLSGSKT